MSKPIKQLLINGMVIKEDGLSEDEVSTIIDHLVSIIELHGAEIALSVEEVEE